jgi:hypothetical protein
MPMIDPAALKPLSAAILSDVMDSLGLMRQAMKPFVRPLDDSLVLVGRARAGLYMPAYEVKDREHPYEAEIALVDDLRPGDVVVLACNGSTDRIAPRGNCCPPPPRRAARPVASSTAWCATCARSASYAFPCSMAASARWTPKAAPA